MERILTNLSRQLKILHQTIQALFFFCFFAPHMWAVISTEALCFYDPNFFYQKQFFLMLLLYWHSTYDPLWDLQTII